MEPPETPPLTIVVPAYDEAEAVRAGRLAAVAGWRDAHLPAAEILVVDDGSADATAALARAALPAPADRVLTIAHGGKAAAVAAGFRAARGARVLFTDMDQATPIAHAADLLRALDGGADVAIGSRGLRRPGAPLGRRLLSWGQVGLRAALLGLVVADTQCGFKAFGRDTALALLDGLCVYAPPQEAGALHGPSVTSGFDVELLFVARRRHLRVAEVPVCWHYADTRRVDLRRDAWRGVQDLLRIAQARLLGAYGDADRPAGRS